MSQTQSCPCGNGVDVSKCCLPFISGKKEAAQAEELLRARYTAFTRGDVDFIMSTHHSKTRGEIKRGEIEEWSKNSTWHGLEVREIKGGGEKDEQGQIKFCARYEADGKKHEHWELSLFEKEGGKWRFLDAASAGPYVREEPKLGRNDPCKCGSGKKYKKCCGVAA